MNEERLVTAIRYLIYSAITAIICMMVFLLLLIRPSLLFFEQSGKPAEKAAISGSKPDSPWSAPDSTAIPATTEGDLIRYGRELVAHTSVYLGPKGKVKQVSNGMNCQNCHLKAGKKFFGNNYAAVASNYPKFRARSGTVESVEKRVNDCIERSLNGRKLDSTSREMRAFVAYITWVGKDVKKGVVPPGSGIWDLKVIGRAADPRKGERIYHLNCARCHGTDGMGVMADNGLEWKYPPLFGNNSYNTGAGLYRLSRLAGYVKTNMPNDLASYEKPALTDEEAWDVAAYINSMPRPPGDISRDWPDLASKPFDHPFGPYADTFTEAQHKYGPFAQIKAAREKKQ